MNELNPLPVAATFSKDPKMWAKGFTPEILYMGDGAYVLDIKGRRYVDWVSALGANLLGYVSNGIEVTSAIQFVQRISKQCWEGFGFSLPHTLEQQVAEKLVTVLGTHIKGWTPEGLGVRFGLSGTDATTMAVRLARAVTGRYRVLSFGYHGWNDWSISVTPPAHGITEPQYVENIEWNEIDALLQAMLKSHPHYEYPAAVIVEQPMLDPLSDWYPVLRKACSERGTLLIMDEVVTWPRFALGGACEFYGVEPDIMCLGKGLGNGVPVSAIVGRREYFDWFSRDDPCFVSSTHFGNTLSLAAANAVLDLWTQEGVDHLWTIGKALMAGLQEAGYDVIGHPPRSLLQFASPAERAYFIVAMRDKGILINRPNLPNLAHTLEDVEKTVAAAKKVKAEMAKVDVEALMADKLPMVLFSNR